MKATKSPAGRPTEFEWVGSPQALVGLQAALSRVSELALDSESNSGFAYEERLCLLQINAADRLWLVDLLALPSGADALEPLRDVLEDPETRVFLHGGEFDVGCLKRDYGISLHGVWDSQQAASYLGWDRTGYGAVVERVLGVKLPKEHAHYDWSQRPIEGEVLQYALNDVKYLPEVCHQLQEKLIENDISDEVDLAFEAVEQATWNGGYQASGFWGLKGLGKIPAESKPLLFALFKWRDSVARRLDMPAGRALNTELILALARNPPSNEDELRRLGLPRRITAKWTSELLGEISSARRRPPELPPRPEKKMLSKGQQKRGNRLKQWRRDEAKRRQVPLQVVLPLVSLKYLQRQGADQLDAVPQLGEKRIELYGKRLKEICLG